MNPALTQFGTQMAQLTGVRAIMRDINETLRAGSAQELINLSAGNPVILPEVEQLWRDCTTALLASNEYGKVVCRYGSSQGYEPLVQSIIEDFNLRYGLSLTERTKYINYPWQPRAILLCCEFLRGLCVSGGGTKKDTSAVKPRIYGLWWSCPISGSFSCQ